MNRVNAKCLLKEGFKPAYGLVPESEQAAFVDFVREEMGWSVSTFYNRLSGRNPLKKAEEITLRKAFQHYNIDLNHSI